MINTETLVAKSMEELKTLHSSTSITNDDRRLVRAELFRRIDAENKALKAEISESAPEGAKGGLNYGIGEKGGFLLRGLQSAYPIHIYALHYERVFAFDAQVKQLDYMIENAGKLTFQKPTETDAVGAVNRAAFVVWATQQRKNILTLMAAIDKANTPPAETPTESTPVEAVEAVSTATA